MKQDSVTMPYDSSSLLGEVDTRRHHHAKQVIRDHLKQVGNTLTFGVFRVLSPKGYNIPLRNSFTKNVSYECNKTFRCNIYIEKGKHGKLNLMMSQGSGITR